MPKETQVRIKAEERYKQDIINFKELGEFSYGKFTRRCINIISKYEKEYIHFVRNYINKSVLEYKYTHAFDIAYIPSKRIVSNKFNADLSVVQLDADYYTYVDFLSSQFKEFRLSRSLVISFALLYCYKNKKLRTKVLNFNEQ